MRNRASRRLGWVSGLVLAAALAVPAAAHITNTQTLFPDIADSSAAGDIVALTAFGVIPQGGEFQPDAPFALSDLAAWAALAHGATGGEAADKTQLAATGRAYLPPAATAADAAAINQAIFDGRLTLDAPAQRFTHAQAAAFIVAHLTPALAERLGVQAGPTGVVTAITSQAEANGHTTYTFTVGGKSYLVYAHAKVDGDTNLGNWTGHTITRSYLRTEDGRPLLIFMSERN